MNATFERQRSIVRWFDGLYGYLGETYLRPVRAYLVFLELLAARPGHRLLDVACGLGQLLKAARGYTDELYGVDISRVAIEAARARLPNARLAVANAERLPFSTSSFDLVTCLGSLERMLDRDAALAEMLRVGHAGARYCLLVRNSNTPTWRYLSRLNARPRAAGHADADTLDNWTRRFETAGFRVMTVLPDQYPLHKAQRWRSAFLRPVDFRKTVTTPTPLDRANEFIFVLEKAS